MHHYSLDMWQVHLKDFAVPDRAQWHKWFPDDKDMDDAAESMLDYLRYVVVEVRVRVCPPCARAPNTGCVALGWQDATSVVDDFMVRW